jgi:hypothetical protein
MLAQVLARLIIIVSAPRSAQFVQEMKIKILPMENEITQSGYIILGVTL